MSNERNVKGKTVALATRVRTLILVGMMGALITIVFSATLEAMQRSEPPLTLAQAGSGAVGAVAAVDGASPSHAVAPETLYLLLLGALLLCVAAGVSAVSSDGAASENTDGRSADRIEPPAVIHTATAVGSTR